jgi:hypothetical protein
MGMVARFKFDSRKGRGWGPGVKIETWDTRPRYLRRSFALSLRGQFGTVGKIPDSGSSFCVTGCIDFVVKLR